MSQASILVPPTAGSSWFQVLSSRYLCCLLHKRIKFMDASGKEQFSPVHGNVFFYLSEGEEPFREVFGETGVVTKLFV